MGAKYQHENLEGMCPMLPAVEDASGPSAVIVLLHLPHC